MTKPNKNAVPAPTLDDRMTDLEDGLIHLALGMARLRDRRTVVFTSWRWNRERVHTIADELAEDGWEVVLQSWAAGLRVTFCATGSKDSLNALDERMGVM